MSNFLNVYLFFFGTLNDTPFLFVLIVYYTRSMLNLHP